MHLQLFSSRMDAAEQLIPILRRYVTDDTILLAIPRGAVPMGKRIADALQIPFDILLVKKIGYPGNPELAIGSVSINDRIVDPEFAVRKEYIDKEIQRLQQTLKERERLMRGDRPQTEMRDKTILILDDGMATGHSMLSAVRAAKQHSARKIIVAVPVSSEGALQKIEHEANEVVCLHVPETFMAVGDFYRDFTEVTDEEVRACLESERIMNSHT